MPPANSAVTDTGEGKGEFTLGCLGEDAKDTGGAAAGDFRCVTMGFSEVIVKVKEEIF